MQIFISYNFLSNDKVALKHKLIKISNTLENLGHTTFIHWRDKQNWGEGQVQLSPKEIIINAFEAIKDCDCLLAFTETKEKSQGMLLEIGYAFALGKKVILAAVPETNLTYVKALAENILVGNTFEEVLEQVRNI